MLQINWDLWKQLFIRAFRRDYLESISGLLWAVLNPLALLGIYAFVFVAVFKAKIPEADTTGFVPYLAVAFWPWMAFAEGLQRATRSVDENAALLSKVAIPTGYLITASAFSGFLINMVGWLAVMVLLQVEGGYYALSGLLYAVPTILLMLLFCTGLAFLFASLQVFIKDIALAMPAFITLWFFATPILYSPTLVPDGLGWLVEVNPIAYFVGTLREQLLFASWQPGWRDLIALAATAGLFFSGR